MSVSPADESRIREIVRDEWARLNDGRSGSDEATDRRGPAVDSVAPDRHRENGVDGRALASDAADDGKRAVGNSHQRANSTDERVLQSGEADASRAAGPNHIKRLAIKSEHGGDGFLLGRHFPQVGGRGRLPSALDVYFGELLGSAGASQVPAIQHLTGQADTAKIADNAVGGAKIIAGAVAYRELGNGVTGDESAGGPAQGNKGVRKIFGKGGSLGSSASDHSHSISFEHLPGAVQDRALLLRKALRVQAALSPDRGTRLLAAAVLSLMHLAFDDYEETGDERRAKEKADDSYFWQREAERYWHDVGSGEGMQPKRRFEREASPDMTAGANLELLGSQGSGDAGSRSGRS